MAVEVCEKQLCRPGPLIFLSWSWLQYILSWSQARPYSSVTQGLSLFTPVFWNLHYRQPFHFQNCPSVDDKWCGCPKHEPCLLDTGLQALSSHSTALTLLSSSEELLPVPWMQCAISPFFLTAPAPPYGSITLCTTIFTPHIYLLH